MYSNAIKYCCFVLHVQCCGNLKNSISSSSSSSSLVVMVAVVNKDQMLCCDSVQAACGNLYMANRNKNEAYLIECRTISFGF